MNPKRLSQLVALIGVVTLCGLLLADPIPQDQSYHNFSDQRMILGIPHFWNVVSNLPFLIFGVFGWRILQKYPAAPNRLLWQVFAIGVTLVAFGSAYYHWAPSDQTLVWDRLPMTIGFMAAICAIGAEALGGWMTRLLWPSLVIGAASVVVWAVFDDLRFYAWVQFFPLLGLLIILIFGKELVSWRSYIWWALFYYVLAKVFEHFDYQIDRLLMDSMSGHSIKHVLAALGSFELMRRVPKLKRT